MKPILLIILIVAACNGAIEYNAPTYEADKNESYEIEVITSPTEIYTVKGYLYGSMVYEKVSTYASDTIPMVEDAKKQIRTTSLKRM